MSDEEPTRDARRNPSTAQVLSLLTSAVVLSVLATAIAITWLTLTRSALGAEQERLGRGARQLASVAAAGVRTTQPRYLAVATDSGIVRLLEADSSASNAKLESNARTALERLRTSTDSGMPIELWNASGHRAAFVGDDLQEPSALQLRAESDVLAPSVRPGLDSVAWRDSLQVGALYHAGGRTYFWIAVPVRVRGRPLGVILQQRRIAANPQAQQTLRELTGDSVSGYYRNVDGTGWTTFGGRPTAPPVVSAADSALRSRPAAGRLIFAEQRIDGTPLVIGLEVSRASVVGSAQQKVRRLGIFAVLLTVLAGVLAWIVGHRVARPLTRIANAAGDLALGNYGARVPLTGTFEIASLADNFNNMARQIGQSRAELEGREEELRMMANAIPQLAWMANPRGEILWLNERWYEYTGASKAADQANLWTAAQDAESLARTEAKWRAGITAGQPFEMEGRLRSRSGELRWFLTRVAPVHDRDGVITRWFGTSTDIQSLRDAREAAEAASRAKSEFLAAMSHELRTPLNAIGGYAELMELGIRGTVSDEQRQDLARIRASQQHLLTLIGSVLDLSRVESGRVTYKLERVPIGELFESLEPLVIPQAASKGQILRFEAPALSPLSTSEDGRVVESGRVREVGEVGEVGDRGGTGGARTGGAAKLAVIADRDKLRQILLNLLSNAIRHTPNGTTISVTARRVGAGVGAEARAVGGMRGERGEGARGERVVSGDNVVAAAEEVEKVEKVEKVEISVRDNGPGIPMNRRQSVFEPFVQLDRSLSKPTDGIGLGLAISRDLARGMGGDLVLVGGEDGGGGGACFGVVLPVG
jgi:PAS domain S-box-containing protein